MYPWKHITDILRTIFDDVIKKILKNDLCVSHLTRNMLQAVNHICQFRWLLVIFILSYLYNKSHDIMAESFFYVFLIQRFKI